jgi:hypothetical protein
MDTITPIVDRLARVEGSLIDCSVGQGLAMMCQHRSMQTGLHIDLSEIEAQATNIQDFLTQIRLWVEPYALPADYLQFIELYGGMKLNYIHWRIALFGIGPMVDEWYEFLMSDSAIMIPAEDGFLHIGSLVFTQPRDGYYPRVHFVLDLAGKIQRGSVIALEPRTIDQLSARVIVADPAAYPAYWQISAPTFAAWLQRILDTHGMLGFDRYVIST